MDQPLSIFPTFCNFFTSLILQSSCSLPSLLPHSPFKGPVTSAQIKVEVSSCWTFPPLAIVYCWWISVLTTLISVWLYLWYFSFPGGSKPTSLWEVLSWIPTGVSIIIIFHCIWVVVFATKFHFCTWKEWALRNICLVNRWIGSKFGIPTCCGISGSEQLQYKG